MNIYDIIKTTVERNADAFPKCDREWVITEWTNALAGEAGEAANEAKKIRRGDYDEKPEEGKAKLAAELADVLAYAFITAHKYGIDLPRAYIQKYNDVSERIGHDFGMDGNGQPFVLFRDMVPGQQIHAARLYPGKIVRYDSGETALMLLSRPHAGGWHGTQCMGGTTFAGGRFYEPTEKDFQVWRDCRPWRTRR